MEQFGQDLVLLEKLAAGGMAEVYRAKQLGFGGFEKTIAVKRILPNYASNDEFKQMFRMEANLCALLQHQNIVQVFGNGEFNGYLYLCMEFVDGKNVRQLLAKADKTKTRIPMEIACHILAETAKGMEYAHGFIDEKTGQSMAIVHRDMSPQNIMLGFEGSVKIVDFGIAKAAARSEVTKAGTLKGKFGYMSPEQAQGMKIDARTDIFALGIILFELLTQRRLFTSDDDLKTLQLVRECKVPRPSKYNPDIPPPLDRIVMKALARETAERYQTSGELYGDLLRFMNQKFPRFIPTDFSKFFKTLFSEEILEDRKRREKMSAETPMRKAGPSSRPAGNPAVAKADATNIIEAEDKTAISHAGDIPAARVNPSNVNDGAPSELQLSSAEEISQIVEPPARELPQSGHQLADRTQAPIGMEEPSAPPQQSDDGVGAFPMLAGPSHLSISIPASSPLNPNAGLKLERTSPQPQSRSVPMSPNSYSSQQYQQQQQTQAPSRQHRYVPHAQDYPKQNHGVTMIVVAALVAFGGYFFWQKSQNAPAPVAHDEVATKTPDSAPVAVATGTTPSTTPAQTPSREPSSTHPTANGFVQPKDGSIGVMVLRSAPRASEIMINGKLLVDDAGSPLKMSGDGIPVHLAPGKYAIELKNSSFNVQWSGEIEVKADRKDALDVVLSK